MNTTYEFIINLHSRTGKSQAIWESLEKILKEEGGFLQRTYHGVRWSCNRNCT